MLQYTALDPQISRPWIPEFGDPDDPAMQVVLEAYSPYHNLDPNATYPRVLFLTRTFDTIVHPAHSRKMVAEMLLLRKPVYLLETNEVGHQEADAEEVTDNAAMYLTFFWQAVT